MRSVHRGVRRRGEREARDLSPLVKEHEERRGTNSGHKAAPFLEGLSCCWCSDASSSRRGGGTRGVAVLTEGSLVVGATGASVERKDGCATMYLTLRGKIERGRKKGR